MFLFLSNDIYPSFCHQKPKTSPACIWKSVFVFMHLCKSTIKASCYCFCVWYAQFLYIISINKRAIRFLMYTNCSTANDSAAPRSKTRINTHQNSSIEVNQLVNCCCGWCQLCHRIAHYCRRHYIAFMYLSLTCQRCCWTLLVPF